LRVSAVKDARMLRIGAEMSTNEYESGQKANDEPAITYIDAHLPTYVSWPSTIGR